MRKPRPTKPSIRNMLTNAWLYIAGFAVIVTVMSEKIPRYRAYTIDGHLCRDCDSNTLKELNRKVKANPKAYFVRDNVKEKWL